jgi:hypothetical protein
VGNLSNPFDFEIWNEDNDVDFFGSTSFYITKKEVVVSSSSRPSSTSPSQFLSGLPTLATLRPTSSAPTVVGTSAVQTSSGGSDKRVVIGLSVGLSVAFVVILGLVIGLYVWRQRRRVGEGVETSSKYSPVLEKPSAGGPAVAVPVSRDGSQAVEYQDEWVRNRA